MLLGKRQQIAFIPGVNPITDSTELDTLQFTIADKVRFQNGKLRKIKGWRRIFPVNNQNVKGYCRNIFSYRDQNDDPIEIFGTNSRLYAYLPETGDYFYNITPLQTDTTAIPDSLSTEYNASVPVDVQTTAGSRVVTLYITNFFLDNDQIQISGVTGGPYNGIPASAFNGSFNVLSLSNAEIQISLGSAATVTGFVSVTMTWAAGYLYVNFPANGLPDGDRVGILGSTDVDGIPAANINIENIITNVVDTNTFVIQTGIIATSSVIAGGGSGTTIQTQILGGAIDQNEGFGFGGGQFGAGEFGAGAQNTSNEVQYPRIWSMDNFGNYLILTPGDPATSSTDNLYYWDNDIATAPVLVSSHADANNVPLAVKWVYVSNNTVVALGTAGDLNQFQSSDVVNFWLWNPSASTYAYVTQLQQANALISQSKARNFDLIFTESEVYLIEFVDKPDIWFFRKLFSTDGVIGPKARAIIEDAVFWMGQGDFYVFDGYTVNVLPNNTLKRYVYDNINLGQSFKSFAYANVEYSEIWFFYPVGQDLECNNYVIYNYKEGHWTTGTLSRSASEEKTNVLDNPILAQSGNTISASIANSISTNFNVLGANPLTTTASSSTVTIAFTPDYYLQVGDKIQISGATDTGGILAANINGVRTVTGVDVAAPGSAGQFGYGQFGAGLFGGDDAIPETGITFTAGASATSSTTGGGSSITIGTTILSVGYTGSNILSVGTEVTISGVLTGFGGFPVSALNGTGPVTFVSTDFFEINAFTANIYSSNEAEGGIFSSMITFPDSTRVFEHETGLNDYNNDYNLYADPSSAQFAPMLSYAQTNYNQLGEGDTTMLIYSVFPDISQQHDMTLTVNVKEFAQSPYVHSQVFTYTQNTTKIDPMMIGRERQYVFTSNVLNGNFLVGKLYEELRPSTPR
jgi:hypothetical protein